MKKITKDTYLSWYEDMLFWRKFEDKLAAVYIQQKVRGVLHLYNGQTTDVDFLQGVFQSFSDAPGGFSEELKEFTWALGAEYVYDDSFALRAGYFNESEDKGARKFLALGAGFKFSGTRVDLSYLFSASRVPSPLENTLRFSLTFDFGSNSYLEY